MPDQTIHPDRSHRHAAVGMPSAAVALLLLASPALAAQIVGGSVGAAKTINGAASTDEFGNAVCGPGDLDGDGIPDYVIAAHEAHGSPGSGMVSAYSGADHTLLWSVDGENSGDRFGHALAVVQDLDGDGHNEVAVSAIYYQNGIHPGAGKVYVLSGADGSEVWSYASIYNFQYFGTSLAPAGDVNGDGFEDVVAGMPNASSATRAYCGRIVVLDGHTGTFIWDVYGTAAYNNFGRGIAGVGDLNSDGYGDIVVGVPGFDPTGMSDAGRLTILSGKKITLHTSVGLYLALINGDQDGGKLGYSVCAVGDVNQDGKPDIGAGAPETTTLYGTEAGMAYVFSGSTLHLKLEQFWGKNDFDHFGKTVAAAGDLDHDGVPDLLVGAPDRGSGSSTDEGSAFAFAGRTGSEILEWEGEWYGGNTGAALCGLGDLNGDGTAEFLVGAPKADQGFTDNGTAQIISLTPNLSMSKLTASVGGDTIDFVVDFHFLDAGDDFQILMSMAGDGPAVFDAGGVEVPLTPDFWTGQNLLGNYPRFTSGFSGNLDGNGDATATIDYGSIRFPVGTKIYFAAVHYSGGLIADSSIVQILTFVP